MKRFIYNHFTFFIIISSILSLTSVTYFWWLSLLSISFLVWNFFNEKKSLIICVLIVIVTVILVIFNFTVIKPSIKWDNKVRADWEKTGYDSTWVAFTQESVNVIVRSIEEYKHKYNEYPVNLSEINSIFIDNHDYSYRLKDSNGHVNGIPFYYERVDSNKFFFASVGKDGIIKTEDDLLPQISIEQEKTSGLIKYVIKTFTQEEIENEKNSVNINKVIKAIEKGDKKVFPNRKLN